MNVTTIAVLFLTVWLTWFSSSQTPPTAAAASAQTPAGSVGLYVYPKTHQSSELQQKDETECYSSAKTSSGVDPGTLASTPVSAGQQPPTQKTGQSVPKGGTVAGAAKGAAGGAAVGAIAGDAGQGAAIGATVGAVAGRRRQKKAEKAANQEAAQQQAKAQQQSQADAAAKRQASLDSFKRAFSACMDARGYSVR